MDDKPRPCIKRTQPLLVGGALVVCSASLRWFVYILRRRIVDWYWIWFVGTPTYSDAFCCFCSIFTSIEGGHYTLKDIVEQTARENRLSNIILNQTIPNKCNQNKSNCLGNRTKAQVAFLRSFTIASNFLQEAVSTACGYVCTVPRGSLIEATSTQWTRVWCVSTCS